ncbi:MATE family efflux transporter [Paenibacillus sp. strain BS8-2]
MFHATTWQERVSLFLKILWPIMVTQVGMYAMNMTDTIMSGQVSTNDLAGVAIGSSLWMPIITGIGGILMAVSPIIAQLVGSGGQDKIGKAVNQALYVSFALAIIVGGLGSFGLKLILDGMNVTAEVHHISYHYVLALMLGLIPLFASNVLRYFFDAQGFTRISMIITLLAIPFNAGLNYVFIFGKLGLPQLGGIGAGYATAITYWIILGISAWMTFRIPAIRGYRLFVEWAKPSLKAWKELLGIGVPIGLSIFFEVSIFSVVTLLMGAQFSTETVAAHQSALSFTSLIFMIPLSISMALTIVVGFSVGGGKLYAARRYTLLGVSGAVMFLTVCSVLLYVFRDQVANLYTKDPEVATLAAQFLVVAIFYQLSDALQASLQGVLRGYKDVRVPFIIAFVSYWIVGIPSGYLLSNYTELGPFGYWFGIIIGLTFAAVGFGVRLRSIEKATRVASTLKAA